MKTVNTTRTFSIKKYKVMMVCISMSLLLFDYSANAQLKGTHLLGDMGLQSGTQPPPSFTPALATFNYRTSKFMSANGDRVDIPNINMFLLGLGGSFVTNAKILGGNYGGSVLIAFASSKIEGKNISTKSSLAFTDTYIQPLQLGWKSKQADFTFGYALYLPTGKYELGGDDNAGLGILTNEFSGGTTVYFDREKLWSFSTLTSYGINSKKKNTRDNDLIVGNVLSIEGGLGKAWYKPVKGNPLPMIINAGMVYYMQFKMTDDKMQIPAIGNTILEGDKDYIYALGAEANIFIPGLRSSIDFRWLGEFGAGNRTQGNSFFITVAPYIKFFEPKKTSPAAK